MLCNGGMVIGRERVLVIDGFYRPQAAAWLSDQALSLAGRRPTDVILTHYHADHSGGLSGFVQGADAPRVWATQTTYDTLLERYGKPSPGRDEGVLGLPIRLLAPDRIVPDDRGAFPLDLGERRVEIRLTSGHTASDMTVHLEDEPITFPGDLIWGRYFPNCMDARPTALMSSVRDLLKDPKRTLVTGHGSLGTASELKGFLTLLEHVEEHSREAHRTGRTAAEAAASLKLPDSLGDWPRLNPSYDETAIQKWLDELSNATG